MTDATPSLGAMTVAVIGTRGYPSYYGGFETAVRRIAPHLVDEGWGVTVYGRPGTTRDDDALRDRRILSVTTWGVESQSLSTLSYGLSSVLHAVRTKPDVALVMNVANGFWLPLLKLRGIPTLVNVDGIEWERAKWGRLAKTMFRWGARATARWATGLVFDAQAIGSRWLDDFGRDGFFIPYGGDAAGNLPVEPGLTHRGYVLVVARFVPENTILEFVDAAVSLSKTHDVVIVGSSGYGGEVEERVQGLAESEERVRWLGHVSDDARLHSLWQHAGAYFHGHSVGGTNPALVQAMALGAPIVARDTVYNREVLGDAGEFVSPDADSIARGIDQVMTDSRRQDALAARALKRGRAEYTWEGVCRAYESALLAVQSASTRRKL
ncbi:glycosyltransferase [Frigoribacterium sp. CFBP9030]|uniref:glycosyltransferase n=1 Tax=Frigoribacterium sp. CFBP9030 TaxID=3096537 RepID=UPI002A69AE49|nr:glycosyltransferase [Frigoribacterium sp. CFBP9030]MDY0892248.1 glycosyltransferase [Frigoribacterium sp. CFBP9030]